MDAVWSGKGEEIATTVHHQENVTFPSSGQMGWEGCEGSVGQREAKENKMHPLERYGKGLDNCEDARLFFLP